ncbi:MAG: DNA translocase FtsK [Clostridiaceae bacterium]|nr:DNA translocase FtsK [Clostridiaceae bacterium]
MLERTAGRMTLEDVALPTRMETASEVTVTPPRTEPQKTKETAVRSEARQTGKKASPALVAPAESESKPKPAWKLPPINLLSPEPAGKTATNVKVVRDLGRRLEETLASFGVEAKVTNITSGPTITRFELMPGVGVKVSRIVSLSDDIALSLAATGLRIEAPIPGKSVIGIEMANKEISTVGIRELLADEQFRNSRVPLLAALGRDVAGAPLYCDLTKMPHLLIAGATGSGKSVCINAILTSILSRMSPEDLRLILIDPKVVELSVYADIPHLVEPVVTEPEKAAKTLGAVVREMDARYNIFAECGVRDLAGYNEYAKRDGLEHMPFWVVVIDELADLMMTAANEVESYIARLTAKARAAGIHLIVATQRPSVDVITGLIKANIPSRIAFAVASQVDSRTVLDMGGAEKLLGRGDMLYSPQHLSKPIRGQGAFISVRDVEKFTSYIKAQGGPRYSEEHMEVVDELLSGSGDRSGEDEMDELLPDAAQICLDAGYGSISILQRRLNVGYPRAARLIDTLEQMGWVGPRDGSRPRKLQFDQAMLEQFKRGQQ